MRLFPLLVLVLACPRPQPAVPLLPRVGEMVVEVRPNDDIRGVYADLYINAGSRLGEPPSVAFVTAWAAAEVSDVEVEVTPDFTRFTSRGATLEDAVLPFVHVFEPPHLAAYRKAIRRLHEHTTASRASSSRRADELALISVLGGGGGVFEGAVPTHDSTLAFWEKHYGTNRALLDLHGDVDPSWRERAAQVFASERTSEDPGLPAWPTTTSVLREAATGSFTTLALRGTRESSEYFAQLFSPLARETTLFPCVGGSVALLRVDNDSAAAELASWAAAAPPQAPLPMNSQFDALLLRWLDENAPADSLPFAAGAGLVCPECQDGDAQWPELPLAEVRLDRRNSDVGILVFFEAGSEEDATFAWQAAQLLARSCPFAVEPVLSSTGYGLRTTASPLSWQVQARALRVCSAVTPLIETSSAVVSDFPERDVLSSAMFPARPSVLLHRDERVEADALRSFLRRTRSALRTHIAVSGAVGDDADDVLRALARTATLGEDDAVHELGAAQRTATFTWEAEGLVRIGVGFRASIGGARTRRIARSFLAALEQQLARAGQVLWTEASGNATETWVALGLETTADRVAEVDALAARPSTFPIVPVRSPVERALDLVLGGEDVADVQAVVEALSRNRVMVFGQSATP